MEEDYCQLGLEKTKNNYGYMHTLSPIGKCFVEFAKGAGPEDVMLDIGAAYGVATIPCLEMGAKVIACDISQCHLQELKARVSNDHLSRLTTICARFPDKLNFQEGSISALLISHVLSFLSRDEMIAGFEKIYRWLKPGGKVYILNYTPYHKTLASFIPVYEARKIHNAVFSGEISDKSVYSSHTLISESVPNRLTLLDMETVHYLMATNKFNVEFLSYIGGAADGVPGPFCLDGKEWIGCIAQK